MVCIECLQNMQEEHEGKVLSNNAKTLKINQYPKNLYYFQGYSPIFTVWVDTERVQKNKKIVNKQIEMSFKSSFCPRCGEKL